MRREELGLKIKRCEFPKWLKKNYSHIKNCEYCSILLKLFGKKTESSREYDHIWAASKKGLGEANNLAVSCRRCNRIKGRKHFHSVMKKGSASEKWEYNKGMPKGKVHQNKNLFSTLQSLRFFRLSSSPKTYLIFLQQFSILYQFTIKSRLCFRIMQ